jgi:hypothetical protein
MRAQRLKRNIIFIYDPADPLRVEITLEPGTSREQTVAFPRDTLLEAF